MSPLPEIRLLTADDVDAYFPLRLEALQKDPESFGGTYDSEAQRAREDVAKQLESSEDSFVMGAFAPHLVGVVGLFRRKGTKLSHKGIIWGMYVTHQARGKSIGRALLQTLIAHVKKLSGFESLQLTVVTTNEAARQLYLSLGFKTYGTEVGALKLENAYLDEDLMELRL